MKNKISLLITILAVVMLVAIVFFRPDSLEDSDDVDEELNIIVSILPQKEFAKAVGGDHVKVTELIPPGSSPATYDLSPRDLVVIEEADIYFRIGHIPFEKSHIEQIISVNPDLTIIDTSESVPLRYFDAAEEHDDADEGHNHGHGNMDPHIWLSPRLVKIQVESIQDALVGMDAENAAEYRSNAKAYMAELDSLDSELKTAFEAIETNVLMVFHPAWGYFADAYGLEQIAIEQAGKEPTASELQTIIDRAKSEDVKVIFVQAQFDKSIAESVAEEIGVVVVQINPLAEDYVKNLRSVGKTISDNL